MCGHTRRGWCDARICAALFTLLIGPVLPVLLPPSSSFSSFCYLLFLLHPLCFLLLFLGLLLLSLVSLLALFLILSARAAASPTAPQATTTLRTWRAELGPGVRYQRRRRGCIMQRGRSEEKNRLQSMHVPFTPRLPQQVRATSSASKRVTLCRAANPPGTNPIFL